jgi:endonuclease YncB( thermonuclease family)
MFEDAEKLERFTLYGISTQGKILSVYDGDTFDICFKVPIQQLTQERQLSKTKRGICVICDDPSSSLMMRMKCRLEGVDARELKSEGGKKAKEILEGYILQKILRCELGGIDKYGRQLIRIFVDEKDLAVHLTELYPEYFCSYDGGAKTWTS